MVVLTFQTIIMFSIDTDTQETKILKRFTSPIKGTQQFKVKKKVKEQLTTEKEEDFFL